MSERLPRHAKSTRGVDLERNRLPAQVCRDQEQWGIPSVEAGCDYPEPTWGEDDVVFECSKVDASALAEGQKIDARCGVKWRRRI